MNNALANLKKAYQAQAITADDYTLQKFFIKHEEKGIARMTIIGIESKYVRSAKLVQQGGAAHRTVFLLASGERVGTFSAGAHRFFAFYATLMGHDPEAEFLHIDITGRIEVDVTVIELDNNKSTYNFDLVDGEVHGFTDYLPTVNELFTALPETATATEVVEEESASEEVEEDTPTEEAKPATKTKATK